MIWDVMLTFIPLIINFRNFLPGRRLVVRGKEVSMFLKRRSRASNFSHTRGFVTSIHDQNRFCWVFLMKHKSEAATIVKNFYNMVHTKSEIDIQIFGSNNDTEYFNPVLTSFILEKGIIHQSFCTETLQQNRVLKGKTNISWKWLGLLCLDQISQRVESYSYCFISYQYATILGT